jgi:hypothetical protein
MHIRRLVAAATFALAVSLPLGSTVLAANPSDNARAAGDFAIVTFASEPVDCTWINPSVYLYQGDKLKNPLNAGKPGPWHDVSVELRIHDICDGSQEADDFGWIPLDTADVSFDRLRSAWVADATVTIDTGDGRQIDATINLVWLASGPASPNQQRVGVGSMSMRVERTAPATISGTLAFTDADHDVLAEDITFTSAFSYDAQIGVFSELIVNQ